MLEKSKHLSFLKLFKNIYSMMKYDLHIDTLVLQKEVNQIKQDLDESGIKRKILINRISQYFEKNSDLKQTFETELSYLRENPNELIFPYKQLKVLTNVESGYDEDFKLPYIVHEGKRLYFPSLWTEDMAVVMYRNFIEKENILGGDYKAKAPHQYETGNFCVKDGNVIFDIGAAEGLFALNAIDKAKKIYLIESDPYWLEALSATFAPYKNKVEIINKLIADKESENITTLSSLLKKELSSSIFVKMDIEGYETTVIKSSKKILSQISDIRLACCTYHKQTDAEELDGMFTSIGYDTEFSDGYMLFAYDNLLPPYFRKGVIRAKKEYI